MRDNQPQWSEDRKVVWLIKQSTFRFCTLPLFAPYTMAHFGGSVKVKLGNVKKESLFGFLSIYTCKS